MILPEIDISTLPDLAEMVGMFGSMLDSGRVQSDDRIIVIMSYLYEVIR
jgi:hypothetical protein